MRYETGCDSRCAKFNRTSGAGTTRPARSVAVVFLSIFAATFIAITVLCSSTALAAIVAPGEILVVGHHGFDAVDPVTGDVRRVLETADISWNLDVAVAGDGMLYFVGSRNLRRVDPITAEMTILNDNLPTNQAHQVHIDANGQLLSLGAVNMGWDGVARTDPATGVSEIIFASSFGACGDGTPFEIPPGFPWFPPPGWDPPVLPLCMPLQYHQMIGQSMDADGTLIIASKPIGTTTYEQGVYRIDLFTGEVETIATSWNSDLRKIQDVVVAHDRTIYAAIFNESAPDSGSCFEDCTQIIEIEPVTGATSVLAVLDGIPGGIAEMEMDRAGDIIILARQGHLVRLDPATGVFEVISDQMSWNAIGIAIYGMVQYPQSAALSGVAAEDVALFDGRGLALLACAFTVGAVVMLSRSNRRQPEF